MALLAWLLLGGMIGWLASQRFRRDEDAGPPLVVAIGSIGGLTGGAFLGHGGPSLSQSLSWSGLGFAALGAIAFVALERFARN